MCTHEKLNFICFCLTCMYSYNKTQYIIYLCAVSDNYNNNYSAHKIKKMGHFHFHGKGRFSILLIISLVEMIHGYRRSVL